MEYIKFWIAMHVVDVLIPISILAILVSLYGIAKVATSLGKRARGEDND